MTCDIAGGARAWDYSAYNPWALTGDAQNHFDPLWGLVDPRRRRVVPGASARAREERRPPLVP
jgi:endoglucanase